MTIEKVKLTKVSVTDENKDGVKYMTKKNKPFWRVGIQTEQHGEAYINGLLFDQPTWEAGQEVELKIFEEEYNGVKGLKFEVPREADVKDAKIKELEAKLANK